MGVGGRQQYVEWIQRTSCLLLLELVAGHLAAGSLGVRTA